MANTNEAQPEEKEWKIHLAFSSQEQRNAWVRLIRQCVAQMELMEEE